MKKKILSLVLAVTVLCALVPYVTAAEIVASGTFGADGDNLTWTLDSDCMLTISGSGAMKDEIIPGTYGITSAVIEQGVTNIGDYAFYDCTLESVSIPDSVTSIGERAFYGCNQLSTVKIPNSVTSIGEWAFLSCSNLKSIIIPKSVTNIGESAIDYFYAPYIYYSGSEAEWNSISKNAEDFNNITMFYNYMDGAPVIVAEGAKSDSIFWKLDSNGVLTVWGEGEMPSKFSGFNGHDDEIKSLRIENGITTISDTAFSHLENLSNAEIAESVTSIGEFAFSECSSLQNIVVPAGVTRIGAYAFNDCTALESAVISEGVTQVGDMLFSGCVSLRSVMLPTTLKNISDSMFGNCTALKSIDIPEGTETIAGLAFFGCTNLEKINIPSTVNWIENEAFPKSGRLIFNVDDKNQSFSSLDGVLFNKDKTEIIKYAKDELQQKYKIPDGVTVMSSYAFMDCSELTDLYIPASVVGYGSPTFSHCGKLRITVDSGNPGLSSQDGILYNKDKTTLICCANDIYTSFEIPDTVTEISWSAFQSCTKMKAIYVPESVKKIGAFVFDDCDDIYYVGSEEQWNTIEISSFGNPITAQIHYNWIENCFEISDGTVTNTDTNNEHSALIIIARYENDVMQDIMKCETVIFKAGTDETFPEYGENCKIFVWNSLDGMKPLCKSK